MTFSNKFLIPLTLNLLLCMIPTLHGSPVALVPIVERSPVLDGQLKEPQWAELKFHAVPSPDATSGEAPTRFKVMTDGVWLYLAAEMKYAGNYVVSDPGTIAPTEDATIGDQFDWNAENLQIRIAPDPYSPVNYHFALAADGHAYDRLSSGEAFDFISGWQQEIQLGENKWTAEIAIPLRALGLQEGLEAGDLLQVDVLRQHGLEPGPLAWSQQAPVVSTNLQYGEWVIGSFPAAAERLLADFRAHLASVPATERPSEWAEIRGRYDPIALEAKKIDSETQWREFRKALADLNQWTRSMFTQRDDSDFVIWEVNPWALPSDQKQAHPGSERLDEIEQPTFQGEYINRALAVSNPGDTVVRVRVRAGDWFSRDLRQHRPSSQHLGLKQVREVITEGNPDRDALPDLREEDLIVLPPGHNAIIWLTLYAGDLEPGLWTAGLELTSIEDQAGARTIPITLKVLPAEIPQGPKPYAIAWVADPAEEPFVRFPEEVVIADFKSYGVSVHIIPTALLNWDNLAYDAEGRLSELPEMQRLSDYIDEVGHEDQIYVLNVKHSILPKELQGDAKDSIIQQNFELYVRHLRSFFENKGMTHLDFAWYAADEASRGAKVQDVINMGKAMQAADPEQQIFVTVYSRADVEALAAMAPYINVWVPKLNMTPEQLAIINEPRPGVRRLSYMVHGRGMSPYRTIRGMGVEALKQGYEGIGIWSYGEWPTFYGHSQWQNGDTGASKYSLTYAGSEELVSSVRKEAWRMAIQDYRYIDWLQQLAAQAKDALAKTTVAEVETLLKTWEQSPDRLDSAISRFRPLVIELLRDSGALSYDTYVLAQEIMEARPLTILTNNPGPFGLPISPSSGDYTYHPANAASSPPKETDPPHLFRRAGAAAGTKEEFENVGALTDDLLGSQRFRAVFKTPSAIVFDFKEVKRLEKIALYSPTTNNFGKLLFSIRSGTQQEWIEIGRVDSGMEESSLPSADGGWIFNLGGVCGQSLKIDFADPSHLRVDEIRIFGERCQK